MLSPQDTCLILLAGGRSLRFGAADKLCASLAGEPLALHAIRAAAPLPLARRLAIVSDSRFPFAAHGFDVVINDHPAHGLSHSIRLGVDGARRAGCAAVLIMLADMPCITGPHLERLFAVSRDQQSVVFSSDGAATSPPALIGADHFDGLSALAGDRGAKALADVAVLVRAARGELADIDTDADLTRLAAQWGSAR